MSKSPRVCTSCGSVAIAREGKHLRCIGCGHTAMSFPLAHNQIDVSDHGLNDVRLPVSGGYMRKPTALDE